MNSTKMKPIPTEYAGVRFRSKSEAVFARCLDLAGWNWTYEPSGTSHLCEHAWDFAVWQRGKQSSYIEYKPSEPTRTYVDNLHAAVEDYWISKANCRIELIESMPQHARHLFVWEGFYMPRYMLIYGNPWNPRQTARGTEVYTPYPIFDPFTKHGKDFCQFLDNGEDYLFSYRHDPVDFGIFNHKAEEARKYRFDLVSH